MKKKIILVLAFLVFGTIAFILVADAVVVGAAKNKIFSDLEDIERNEVGLVLGTAKYLKDGRINLYFQYRVDAAVALFKNKKIDFVLVSGDNGSIRYDEPTAFKQELIKRGVPENKIFLDYAGFRTLDSVVRAKEIFGQTKITIISQQFHNERAIYLASKKGLDAIGYNAQDVSARYGLKVRLREYLARTKALVDIWFGVQPKFLGKKITIS